MDGLKRYRPVVPGGAALGVMSQGELHSLALSLFIPRATLPESPFRLIVIDDPVQSMDPARVDGQEERSLSVATTSVVSRTARARPRALSAVQRPCLEVEWDCRAVQAEEGKSP